MPRRPRHKPPRKIHTPATSPWGKGHKDRIPGGRADKRHPRSFDPDQLAYGTRAEMVHTSDPGIARELAMDNLAVDPEHYVKLRAMEIMASARGEKNPQELKQIPEPISKAGKGRDRSAEAGAVFRFLMIDASYDQMVGRASLRGRKPTEEEKSRAQDRMKALYKAREAHDYNALNHFLSDFLAGRTPPPSNYAPPSEARKREALADGDRHRQRAPSNYQQRARFAVLQAAARRKLAQKFSFVWSGFDRYKQAGFVAEVLALWLEVGLELGYIKGFQGGYIYTDPGVSLNDIKFRHSVSDRLLRSMDGAVGAVHNAWRVTNKDEVPFGEDIGQAGGGDGVDPERKESLRQRRWFGEELFEKELAEVEELKGWFIRMHMGDSVLPGQPPRLLGGSGGLAYRDLLEFHPIRDGGDPCPTCAAISRFTKQRGGPSVSYHIDMFMFNARRTWAEGYDGPVQNNPRPESGPSVSRTLKIHYPGVTCCLCGDSLPPGGEAMVHPSMRGPRGGKKYAHPQCLGAKANPRVRRNANRKRRA